MGSGIGIFLSNIGHFGLSFVNSFHFFAHAMWVTIQFTIVSLAVAVIIGSIFALFSFSKVKPLIWLNTTYVWLVRGTPLILQIMIVYYAVPSALHLNLGPFEAGVMALALHNGAYLSEIFRGAIVSVPRGQSEAARALGMSRSLAMRRVIAPQAFKLSIPPMINQFIIGLKDSSLMAYIGVSELFNVALSESSNDFHFIHWFSIAAIYYLVLTAIFTVLGKYIERRLDVSKRKHKPVNLTPNSREVPVGD